MGKAKVGQVKLDVKAQNIISLPTTNAFCTVEDKLNMNELKWISWLEARKVAFI